MSILSAKCTLFLTQAWRVAATSRADIPELRAKVMRCRECALQVQLGFVYVRPCPVQLQTERALSNIGKVFSVATSRAAVWRRLAGELKVRKKEGTVDKTLRCGHKSVKDTMTRDERLAYREDQKRAKELDALVLEWVTEGRQF
jgi:hypothetical protein